MLKMFKKFYFSRFLHRNMNENKPLPPSCKPLLTASQVTSPDDSPAKAKEDEGVKMVKSIGLIEGTAIILGIIMGSGKRQLICTLF